MTLGEKIYKLRTKRSMTQEQLAEKLNVSQNTIAKIFPQVRTDN